jgi:hypothetical protein
MPLTSENIQKIIAPQPPIETKKEEKYVKCRFCGKPNVDWDEQCDGEGFHSPKPPEDREFVGEGGEDIARCGLCGEPMPVGEESFMYHGYSGVCPKPPLIETKGASVEDMVSTAGKDAIKNLPPISKREAGYYETLAPAPRPTEGWEERFEKGRKEQWNNGSPYWPNWDGVKSFFAVELARAKDEYFERGIKQGKVHLRAELREWVNNNTAISDMIHKSAILNLLDDNQPIK